MQPLLTTFLAKCDASGQILGVYWLQPATLISPFQQQLSDLFIESDHRLIHEMIGHVLQAKNELIFQPALHLRSPKTSVSIYSTTIEDQIFIMGVDAGFLDPDDSGRQIKYVIHEFMKLVNVSDNELTGEREQTIRLQFEQIQKLNNMLLNTQRQLSRANAELNRLNSYLNNRLVKDELTGLVSRYQYREEIELQIREQPDKLGVFTFIDIDYFKTINDTHGHRVGDTFLQIFSKRLQQIEYNNKICMRISGDEFGLYLHGFTSVDDVEISSIWKEIEMKILSTPADIGELSVPIHCSAGMAIFGMDTREIYDLIEYADFAMYQAKNHGRNTFRRFDMSVYRKEKD